MFVVARDGEDEVVDGAVVVAHHAAYRRAAHVDFGIVGVEVYRRGEHFVGCAEVILFHRHARKSDIGLGAARIQALQFLEVEAGLGISSEHKLGVGLLVYYII